jgi:type VI secretion system protein ImpH
MAANKRSKLYDLRTDIIKNSQRYEFWQLLRLLEMNGDLTEVQLQPAKSLDFPVCDINQCSNDIKNRLVVELNFMGLYGKDSPLPQHFLEFAQQNSVNSESLRAFLNIFSHKLYFLLYQAWRKYHPFLFFNGAAAYRKYLNSLAGSNHSTDNINGLIFPGLLGAFSHNCCSLAAMVSDHLDGIKVKVKPFAPTWVQLTCLPKFGRDEIKLGDISFLGDKIASCTQKIIIQVGPIAADRACNFLPGQSAYKKLRELIYSYVGPTLVFTINLIINIERNFCAKLGIDTGYLNWHSWLGVPLTDIYEINFAA